MSPLLPLVDQAPERVAVILEAPSGQLLDVTDRVASVRQVTEELEEDAGQLVHDDLDLELRDRDGLVRSFLRGAGPGQEWVVRVYQRLLEQRRRPWCTLFAGLLDVPFSIQVDRRAATVRLQVFSYSKALDLVSAEQVRRAFDFTTASGSGSTVTVDGTTTNVAVGDELELNVGGSPTYAGTVTAIASGTQLTVSPALNATYVSVPSEITTPYYRQRSVQFLVDQVLEAAGIKRFEIVSGNPATSAAPFPQAVVLEGVDGGAAADISSAAALSLVQVGSAIRWYRLGEGFSSSSDLTGDWTQGATGNTAAVLDWRPYLDAEPGSLISGPVDGNGYTYHPDYTRGDYWRLLVSGTTRQAELNGTTTVDLELGAPSDVNAVGFGGNVAHEPSLDRLWFCYPTSNLGSGGHLGFVDRDDSDNVVTLDTSVEFQGLALLRRAGVVFVETENDWRFYSIDGGLQAAIDNTPRITFASYVREVGNLIAVPYFSSGAINVRFLDRSLNTVADVVAIDGASEANVKVAVWQPSADATERLVIATHDELRVLSTEFEGVIDYADFDDLTAADAMSEFAALLGSWFQVDASRSAAFVARTAVGSPSTLQVRELEAPIAATETPFPVASYATQVTVSGQAADGSGFEVVRGNPAPGARDLELESRFIRSEQLAGALGDQLVAYTSQQRGELDVTVIAERPYHVLQLVRFEGVLYRVTRVRRDIQAGTQALELVEVLT